MLSLALNGGGIAGYATALLLSTIETSRGVRVKNLFNLVAGVSTGSIVAAGIGTGMSMAEIAELYRRQGTRIFKKRWQPWAGVIGCSKYKAKNLAAVLTEALSPATMKDLEVDTMIHAVRIAPQVGMHHWKSWDDDGMTPLADIVRASCSAWTYFEPCVIGPCVYMDGGQGENNPSVHCAVEAVRLGHQLHQIKVLNIELIRPNIVKGCKARKMTSGLSGLPTVPESMIAWSAASARYSARQLLGSNYLPVNLDLAIEMDDVSPKSFAAMDAAVDNYWQEHGESILRFVGL